MTEYYHDFSSDLMQEAPKVPEETIDAVALALDEILNRSFSGRHPELGKMINCRVCDMRHRQNERKCEQKFVAELIPPEGLTSLTARQQLGAKFFAKRRRSPRNRPQSPMHHWLRVLVEAHKKKEDSGPSDLLLTPRDMIKNTVDGE